MIRWAKFWVIALIAQGMLSVFAAAQAAPSTQPDLGIGASLHGKRMFPADNWWNRDISNDPVDPDSDAIVAGIGIAKSLHPDFGTGINGAANGIAYVVVGGNQPKVAVTFLNPDESDPGPYPIPPDAPIEGGANSGADRHVLVVDRDNWILYELFGAGQNADGSGWSASSGAVFDLNSNRLRPRGWTSADAAGLPILTGLVRYDEVVEQGHIDHALRFTARRTRAAFIPPATHFASHLRGPDLPPMGMRVRLKASVDISRFPPTAQVILKALKQYGMILADNGGSWFLSGAPDPRWNDAEIEMLKHIRGRDFEVVQMEQ
jgi:hypothetical protein